MIINFPTGLYSTVLPQDPEDSGNVTFTISNTNPPRTNLIFPKVPAGLVDYTPTPPNTDRHFLGDLAFTITTARTKRIGTSARQYELGQILEFNDVDSVSANPMLVNPVTTIQHDTNKYDYSALGITPDEQALIAQESLRTYEILRDELNELKQIRADSEVDINVNQKLINETTKTVDALTIIADQSNTVEIKELIVKLNKKRNDAFIARDAAIAIANDAASKSEALLAELQALATVVK